VARQRTYARGKDLGALTESRKELLDDIEFDWGTAKTIKVPWEERYNELLEFKAKFGHCNVTQRTEFHTLALWVARQRKNYQCIKEGKSADGLSEERMRLLEEAGFEWRRHKYKNRTKKSK